MKILDFIICDDIRREMGNKHSLIGMYDESIEFTVPPDKTNIWPKAIRIGLYIKIKVEDNEEISEIKMRMKFNDKEVVLGVEPLKVPKTKPKMNIINIVLINPAFVFEGQGSINFFFDIFDDSQKLVATLSPDVAIQITEKVQNTPSELL
jgi:hypothetical protein